MIRKTKTEKEITGMPTPKQTAAIRVVFGSLLLLGGSVVGGWVGTQLSVRGGPVHNNISL